MDSRGRLGSSGRLAALLMGASLAACSPTQTETASVAEPAAATAASVIASAATADSPRYERKTETPEVDIELELPPVKGGAVGMERLWQAMNRDADEFQKEATAGWKESEAAGYKPPGPYALGVEGDARFANGSVISVVRSIYTYTGGAHPNGSFAADTFEASTGKPVTFGDLFGADWKTMPVSKAIGEALCADLRRRKAARLSENGVEPYPFECPDIAGLPWTLEPGSEPTKVASLLFHLDAYVIGSHAEGPYTGQVDHVVFRDSLQPRFKALFGGTMVRVDDL